MSVRLATINQLQNGSVVPLSRLFRDLFAFPAGFSGNRAQAANGPLFDVLDATDEYIVKSDLPGFDKDGVNLTYENKTLTLSGERKREEVEGLQYHRVESFSGKFSRSMKLPIDIDVQKISAELSNGVLTVHLPKAEAAKPKQISISIG